MPDLIVAIDEIDVSIDTPVIEVYVGTPEDAKQRAKDAVAAQPDVSR